MRTQSRPMPFTEERMKQVFDTNIIDFAVQNGFVIDPHDKKSDRNCVHVKNSGGLYLFRHGRGYKCFTTESKGNIIAFAQEFMGASDFKREGFSMSQAKRYNTLCTLTGRNNLDSAYHTAFYLLSYDKELYETACKAVSHDGIDFAKIKRTTRGFDERTRFVVDIAHNLFSYNSPCKATPFEISRLGYPLMEQVCNALYIAADQLNVIVRPDEQQKAVMELDAEPYQKTKRTHAMLERLQESMMTQQDEGDELER